MEKWQKKETRAKRDDKLEEERKKLDDPINVGRVGRELMYPHGSIASPQ